jgi:hypothetical protein
MGVPGGLPFSPGTRKVAEVDIDADGFVLGTDFLLGDGDSAEEKIGNVGEYGGAACGNEVGGEEFIEFRERVVDAYGSGEVVAIGGEPLEEVCGGLPFLVERVAITEGRVTVRDGEAAKSAGGQAEEAVERLDGGGG